MKIKVFLFLLLPSVLFSCRSIPQDITYLQGIDNYKEQIENYEFADAAFRFSYDDQIIISVSSPEKDQEKVAQFNLPVNTYLRAGQVQVQQTGNLQTYIVDNEGYINFPVLGKIHVANKTKSELTQNLTESLKLYLLDPVVNISTNTFYVTLSGEVNKPGVITTAGETLTIFEALSRAGDISIYANRKNVLVMRTVSEKKEVGRLDLTDPEIIFSPYFHLKAKDWVYIEPNDTKKKSSNIGASENYRLSIVSLSLTAISLITSIILLTKK